MCWRNRHPDLDQQLMQARADLGVSQANAKLRKSARSGGSRSQAPTPLPSKTLTPVLHLNANMAQSKRRRQRRPISREEGSNTWLRRSTASSLLAKRTLAH